MSSKKQEERNEKVIRGLMKLPPNRRCINCNSLGPQYVCTTFWTFVCVTCSGIHREFTHRVKSVSMAKFTVQEVEALQNGGNQRAREIYLKGWDPQGQRFPDNSKAEKVREFIKDVYVDKKYAGEKFIDKPPRNLQNQRSLDETRRASSYHSYSQSPPYDFQYEERKYGKNALVLTRKTGSDRGLYEGKVSSFLSPTHSEKGPRMSDYSTFNRGESFMFDTQSPNFEKDNESPFSETSRDISPEDNSMSLKSVNSEPSMEINTGWATFDPQNVVSSLPSSQGDSVKSFDEWAPFDDSAITTHGPPLPSPDVWKVGPENGQSSFNAVTTQWSSFEDFSAKESQNIVEATSNTLDTQSWNAFEDSTVTFPIQTTQISNEQIKMHPLAIDQHLNLTASKDLSNDVTHKAEVNPGHPFSVISPHIPVPFDDFSKNVETHTYKTDNKSTNPFDLPYDSEIESANMFWDMSSLQATNGDIPILFTDDVTQTWFPVGPETTYIPTLPQTPNTQIPNLQVQGPVASIGGNPFA